ncbi:MULTISPECIES: bifunctional transcriptional activator/DNA repair enzyme AdaA [unclassified Ensifer]|uniref:bifunctional transcriptional activator/DNA repair enzyme AdaA n=1 Tax=unclassified Ensifer TaxID=2633371 RepID=UPI0007130568|nr:MULTISPECIES: trifunctional transcriptional activator/DNA repair protein Ada/methylated-DNA--[protein]-cysteine S-methyltransferase [unclassified Ensifer]KQX54320.1 6-O-methylguanine DNA methyltransferase [Ensifer sp. Root1298]KQX86008.1 6-O-methylguanine DNA methyltransferase [Ensifer sp. Root1312]KRC23068.1 6-O-methylguanine DNA methyltransferase [Ensifer sp. Root74]KRD57162.1 6-O-methylguanine DNA methyltransferase [Ensifer sp. Root954]
MLFDLPSDETLYDALMARSSEYEGSAFVCVKTTGVFCRLSCSARKPKRENTIFVGSIGTCLETGFRPCQRCRPLATFGAKDTLVQELLQALEAAPERRWSEDDIVRRGLDPSTVRRAFKRALGITFLDLARHRRLGLAARQLADGGRVIDAQLEAGYESPSGFRAAFQRLLGDAPAAAQGRALLSSDWIETPIGPMVAVADATHLHLLEFHERKALPTELEALKRATRSAIVPGRTAPIDQIEGELKSYFAGEAGGFQTPLAPGGTPFERNVWAKLVKIPAGGTRSYGDIAREVATIQSARAVAKANGSNRIAIVIPCHRCIGADGSLTGYGGGLWRKQWLLRHEAKMKPVSLLVEETQ